MAEDVTEVVEEAVEIIVEVKEVIAEAIGIVSKEQEESPGELSAATEWISIKLGKNKYFELQSS